MTKAKTLRKSHSFIFSVVFIIQVIKPCISPAFFERQDGDRYIDLRGSVRAYGTMYQNPDNDFYFRQSSDTQAAGTARLLMQSGLSRNLRFEFNIYQTVVPDSLISSQAASNNISDVERSSAVEWSLSNDRYTHLAFDRFNLQWTYDRISITAGRQPVNLATTFYFSPNDLFAPFAAQTFYRVYKPGVDALRSEIRLGDFSQLSLIGVLGYDNDPQSITGWTKSPESSRNSYLGRISAVMHNFEWAAICGELTDKRIIGGSLQGEIFKWLGIRAEGHRLYPGGLHKDSHTEFAVGLEHRWENSLNIRLEQFYHGSGSGTVSDYAISSLNSQTGSSYLGRNYTALGTGYEFSPLLTGDISAFINQTDHSFLMSLNFIYSLADEVELSFNLSSPFGKEPDGPVIKSEFGMAPYSFIVEMRHYF